MLANLFLMKRINLIFFFLIGITLSGCAQESNFKSINVSEAKQLIDTSSVIILDVRTPAETAKGKLPSAIEMDYLQPTFTDIVKALDKEKTVLVYCKSGGRSKKACKILKQQGFKTVYNLKTGYDGWKNEY